MPKKQLTKNFINLIEIIVDNNYENDKDSEVKMFYEVYKLKDEMNQMKNELNEQDEIIENLTQENNELIENNENLSTEIFEYKKKYEKYKNYLKNLNKKINNNQYNIYQCCDFNYENNDNRNLSLNTFDVVSTNNDIKLDYSVDNIECLYNIDFECIKSQLITMVYVPPKNKSKPSLIEEIEKEPIKKENEDNKLYYKMYQLNENIQELENEVNIRDITIESLHNENKELLGVNDDLATRLSDIEEKYRKYKDYLKKLSKQASNNKYKKYDSIKCIVKQNLSLKKGKTLNLSSNDNYIRDNLKIKNNKLLSLLGKRDCLSVISHNISFKSEKPELSFLSFERVDNTVTDLTEMKKKEEALLLYELFELNTTINNIQQKIDEDFTYAKRLINENEELNLFNKSLSNKITQLKNQDEESKNQLIELKKLLINS